MPTKAPMKEKLDPNQAAKRVLDIVIAKTEGQPEPKKAVKKKKK